VAVPPLFFLAPPLVFRCALCRVLVARVPCARPRLDFVRVALRLPLRLETALDRLRDLEADLRDPEARDEDADLRDDAERCARLPEERVEADRLLPELLRERFLPDDPFNRAPLRLPLLELLRLELALDRLLRAAPARDPLRLVPRCLPLLRPAATCCAVSLAIDLLKLLRWPPAVSSCTTSARPFSSNFSKNLSQSIGSSDPSPL
jgi:hypothetical protein